jgi:hypothetical protein
MLWQGVMFYGPGCEHCKDLAEDWERIAASFKRRRIDTAFGRVNCAHGDQTYRAPTEEEIDNGVVPGEYYDDSGTPLEGAKDGEVVCEWYKIKETPLIVLFHPNSQRPKRLDAPRTLTGITGWIEDEIETNQAVLGRNETVGLTTLGLQMLDGEAELALEAGCDDVRAANTALRHDVEQFKLNKQLLEEESASLSHAARHSLFTCVCRACIICQCSTDAAMPLVCTATRRHCLVCSSRKF